MMESEAYAIDADMTYEEEPADFTEALFDKNNHRPEPGKCILCTHSNGALNGGGMKAQLDRIDSELCGRVEDAAIFDLQAQWYKEHIYDPLRRHEPDTHVPSITAEDCRQHYVLHAVNPRRMLKNDIQFLDSAQRFLQSNGILNKNRSSGKLNLNLSFLKQWNVLSRNKLDLLRYYRQEYLRDESEEQTSSGPTEFSSF
jgi:hypothetical protein